MLHSLQYYVSIPVVLHACQHLVWSLLISAILVDHKKLLLAVKVSFETKLVLKF